MYQAGELAVFRHRAQLHPAGYMGIADEYLRHEIDILSATPIHFAGIFRIHESIGFRVELHGIGMEINALMVQELDCLIASPAGLVIKYIYFRLHAWNYAFILRDVKIGTQKAGASGRRQAQIPSRTT